MFACFNLFDEMRERLNEGKVRGNPFLGHTYVLRGFLFHSISLVLPTDV